MVEDENGEVVKEHLKDVEVPPRVPLDPRTPLGLRRRQEQLLLVTAPAVPAVCSCCCAALLPPPLCGGCARLTTAGGWRGVMSGGGAAQDGARDAGVPDAPRSPADGGGHD